MNAVSPGPKLALLFNSKILSANFESLSNGYVKRFPWSERADTANKIETGHLSAHSRANLFFPLPRGTNPSKTGRQAALSRVSAPKSAKLPSYIYSTLCLFHSLPLGTWRHLLCQRKQSWEFTPAMSGSNHIIPLKWKGPTSSKNPLWSAPKTPSQTLHFLVSIINSFHIPYYWVIASVLMGELVSGVSKMNEGEGTWSKVQEKPGTSFQVVPLGVSHGDMLNSLCSPGFLMGSRHEHGPCVIYLSYSDSSPQPRAKIQYSP